MESICRKLSITLLLSTFSFLLVHAQGPDTLWTRTYGGNDEDYATSVQQTTDQGYIVAGSSTSFRGRGGFDVYLIKTDPLGDTLWTKIYGTDGYPDFGNSVQQTSDGGYIIGGNTRSFGSGRENMYVIKTDANGDTLWTKTYGGDSFEDLRSIKEDRDGGYIIAGGTESYGAGGSDFYMVRINESGDTLWTKTFGGQRSDICHSCHETSDNGYILAGVSTSFTFRRGVYLVKTDSLGNLLWTRIQGYANQHIYCYSVQQTVDQGYILAGDIYHGPNDYDAFLTKTDTLGAILWRKIIGEPNKNEHCYSMQQTSDHGFILAGYVDLDLYIVKTDSMGDTLWTKTDIGTSGCIARSIQQTVDQGYIIAGQMTSMNDGLEIYLIKTAPDPGIEEEKDVIKNHEFGPTILSGPLVLPKDKTCRVYDITGRVVVPDKIKPGIYFIEVDGQITKKVVKVR